MDEENQNRNTGPQWDMVAVCAILCATLLGVVYIIWG